MNYIYFVFAMNTYYPEGGFEDCVGIFRTEEEARQEQELQRSRKKFDWVYIERVGAFDMHLDSLVVCDGVEEWKRQ